MHGMKRFAAILLLATVASLGAPQAFAGAVETPGRAGAVETPGRAGAVETPGRAGAVETPGIIMIISGIIAGFFG